METITIHGRKVYPGVVEGEALVSPDAIGCFGSIKWETGIVTEKGHALFGECLKGKVLVFPSAKGSSSWGSTFQSLRYYGNAPAAMLIKVIDGKSGLGAVLSHTPSMTDFDENPLEIIEDGDWVKVDADNGVVTVTKK